MPTIRRPAPIVGFADTSPASAREEGARGADVDWIELLIPPQASLPPFTGEVAAKRPMGAHSASTIR